jgi:hypothetical protein
MMLVINDRVRFFRHDHEAVAKEVAQIINYTREARKARLSGPDALKEFELRHKIVPISSRDFSVDEAWKAQAALRPRDLLPCDALDGFLTPDEARRAEGLLP